MFPAEKIKTRISTVGSLNSYRHTGGFTLIELIVVVSIISIVLLFSFPLFRDVSILSGNGGDAGDLARLTEDLKKRAVKNHHDYFLHLDKTAGRIWVISEDMEEEQKRGAEEKATSLSGRTRIVSVQFAGQKKKELPEYVIRFRKQGYSDHALIQIIENGNQLTLKIEPFLPETPVTENHVDFEECI